jgi:hypothetical protein
MSRALLTVLVVVPTAAVLVALIVVMWRARTTPASSRAAILTALTLAAWALSVSVLGVRGTFRQPDGETIPPIAVALAVALGGIALALRASASLRSLFTNQQHVIRLNVWRLEGVVFLVLMLAGQMPALWALPAGIGDIVVAASAFWVAGQLTRPSGRRTAIAFNVVGLADLVVAVALGIATSPGPLQGFHTTPTSELLAHFPLVLVATFLVPLAIALHVISLAQLLRGPWTRNVSAALA